MRSTKFFLGTIAFTVSVIVLVSTQAVAQSAWHNPKYRLSFNNISDLGNVKCGPWSDDQRYVCSPRHSVANAGFLVGGLIFLVGVWASRGLWKANKFGKIAHVFLYGNGLLWLTVGLWPADINEGLHLTAWLWLLLAEVGLMMSYVGMKPEVTKAIRILAPVVGMTGVFLASTTLDWGAERRNDW